MLFQLIINGFAELLEVPFAGLLLVCTYIFRMAKVYHDVHSKLMFTLSLCRRLQWPVLSWWSLDQKPPFSGLLLLNLLLYDKFAFFV